MGELEAGGRDDIPVSALILLAEVFNVRPADLLEGSGAVHLGITEQPLELISRMLSGKTPLDPGLAGPRELPGMNPEAHGEGPYWVKPAVRGSVIYSALEVKAALSLGVFAEDIHEASQQMWDRIIDLELVHRLGEDSGLQRAHVERELIDELGSSRELVAVLRVRLGG